MAASGKGTPVTFIIDCRPSDTGKSKMVWSGCLWHDRISKPAIYQIIKFYEADVPVLRLHDQLMMMDGETMQGLGSECPRQIPSRTQVRTVSVRGAP